MDLRPLTEHDAAAYFALRLAGLLGEPRAFGRDADAYRHDGVEGAAARLRAVPHAFTLGAFLDGALVGAATLVRRENPKERHKADVFAVYVAPEARGRGAAGALVDELVRRARDTDGLEQLHLAVSVTQDAARRLYVGRGFVPFGVEPRALKVDGEYVDEEHMVLRL